MVQIDGVTDSRLQQETLDKIGTDPILAAAVREAAKPSRPSSPCPPRGHRIPSTIRPNADDAWAALRASISDPDILHEAGWRIHRLECTVIEVSE